MFEEMLNQVDGMFDVILTGSLPEKIAKVTRKLYLEFLAQGFSHNESVQFITAILSKKG